jgi:hypothetical protein
MSVIHESAETFSGEMIEVFGPGLLECLDAVGEGGSALLTLHMSAPLGNGRKVLYEVTLTPRADGTVSATYRLSDEVRPN